MERYSRGTHVPITVIFYGATGDILQPTSATIAFSYPQAISPTTQVIPWPLDGEDQLSSTASMASISTTAGTWGSTWNSAVASTGVVFWTAYSSTDARAVVNGQFELTGNLANPLAIPSTA